MYEDVRENADGIPYCAWCRVPLQAEEKVVGLVGKQVHSVYRCRLCLRMHWSPKKPIASKLAS
jgi:hypothetical protein